MATYPPTLRRGLPRERGGDAWPPLGDAPIEIVAARAESPASGSVAAVPEPIVDIADVAAAPAPERPSVVAAAMGPGRSVRRGLPRVPGGEPWPAAAPAVAAAPAPAAASPAAPAPQAPVAAAASAAGVAAAAVPAVAPAATALGAATSERPLRRGLPRVKGGEAWPAAGFAPVRAVVAEAAPVTGVAPAPVPPAPVTPPLVEEAAVAASVAPVPAAPPQRVPLARPAAARPAATRPATAGPAPRPRPAPAPAPKPGRFGAYTFGQLLGSAVIGGFGLLLAATFVVVVTNWFLTLGFMQDFLATYPGETHLPEGAPVGLPAWLGWQHFFNVFLIVLIIRSGLQVRTEKRPAAYWTPRWSKGGQGKISLNLWFHQSLDILWLVNGIVFVVLLFATGQWMRVVPTSWEYIPNAISATLQYVSLDWPLENGWVNYNSLQVLAYFVTIFIAAPLAAVTGVRMSGLWPKNAKTLNRIYPVEWARAVHFPVMLYFVAFIVVHVALVFLTGALRNLNHMYAAQDVVSWLGFWIFVASLVVIAAAWVAARPMVLAPIAGLFGKVGR
ncbi:cytochrome b/b6 domain-containing protein [Agromyces sp. SYSU K20354]|uniref:cytochrome b/b6 domain-containing protein n=1 Tax=Agromyces cavernae TaxID=2898659 RepID=UPI001E505D1D|nr:cytochrome b/b6 domain-containing protein [Agromyces cavernae]MCD2443365.1 cytochrome b/b6 domain-containing protein [Agromyces cavernae]